MERKALRSAIVCGILFIVIWGPTVITISNYLYHKELENRIYFDNINIQSSRDFYKKYRFPGSGTETDPYLIENKIINSSSNIGIYIADVSSYFIIRNCEIYSPSLSILIYDVYSGNALIENNICNNGIDVSYISKVVIKDNIIINHYSYGQSIGIAFHGIYDISIINNTCMGFNQGISKSQYHYSDPYLEIYLSNNKIMNNKRGIYLFSVFNTLIADNIFQENEKGLVVSISGAVAVFNNQFHNNSDVGLQVDGEQIIIGYNLIEQNEIGLLVGPYAFGVNIFGNLITQNTMYGLKCYNCFYTSIYHNNFIDNNLLGFFIYNNSQAFSVMDDYEALYFYDPTLHEGNYWSDLIWTDDANYVIDSYPFFVDPHPLEHPVEI